MSKLIEGLDDLLNDIVERKSVIESSGTKGQYDQVQELEMVIECIEDLLKEWEDE